MANHLPVKSDLKTVIDYMGEAVTRCFSSKGHVSNTVFRWRRISNQLITVICQLKRSIFFDDIDKPFLSFIASDFPHIS